MLLPSNGTSVITYINVRHRTSRTDLCCRFPGNGGSRATCARSANKQSLTPSTRKWASVVVSAIDQGLTEARAPNSPLKGEGLGTRLKGGQSPRRAAAGGYSVILNAWRQEEPKLLARVAAVEVRTQLALEPLSGGIRCMMACPTGR